MLCPSCHAENHGDRRFCLKCGTPLARVCAACGFTNEPAAEFCGGCGARLETASAAAAVTPDAYTPKHLADKILSSKAALEGERKQITVLFADLKGSMELLADRDPEEARKILDAVVERMMDAVHHYEGTVNQVMGDGIMALFGAPVAHEDHAARACYAALRMQETAKRYADEVRHTLGVNIQIRVGLNSGEVVVRAIGSDLRMDYTAVGQTTHLAARMEQFAIPGTIVIAPATLALVEGLVAVTGLGPVPVKGVSEPLEVFEVTGVGVARTRLHAAARRGLTRFVGRDAELEQLWRAQELAGKGRGQVVAVVGEAGVGKSRLVYEFTHSHRLQGWLVLEAASVSYGKATSYLPVIALLKTYFKIQDRDDVREVREKATGKLLALDRALEPSLPALLSLLDVPVEDTAWQGMLPAQRRQQTLDGVKRLLLRETREQPLAVVFEDLHWIDGETQALLDGLVESLGSARLLLLVNYRPEYHHAWAGKTYYSQSRLDALPPESTAELLVALLGEDPGLAPLRQLLVKRGNPFFVEESVRTLVETKALAGERGRYRLAQPISSLQIPPTVQTMLAARIDRLPPEEKQLLQVAAVVGKDVPFSLLREIAEEPEEQLRSRLGHLQTAEFLYETTLFPDVEYSFKHALTHEVTYEGLLQERRRELHARIVGAIETIHRDRLGEQIERLAYHALRARLSEKAVIYLWQAGLRAEARFALREAQGWYEQALDTLEALPESPSRLEQGVDIRVDFRRVLSALGEVKLGLERLRAAELLAQRLKDERRLGVVFALITNCHAILGELDEAVVAGGRALEIAQRLAVVPLRVLAAAYLAQTHYYRGEYERVVELATANIDALPADFGMAAFGASMPLAFYHPFRMFQSLAELGRFSEAIRYETEARRMVRDYPGAVALIHFDAGWLYCLRGDWGTARPLIELAAATYRSLNIVGELTLTIAAAAWLLARLGETSEALIHLREAESRLERDGARQLSSYSSRAYRALGHAALVLGRIDEAQSLGDLALRCARSHHGYEAHTRHLLGEIWAHPECFDAGRAKFQYHAALALAEPRGMRPLVAHCHLGLGKLYRRTSMLDEARQHLTTATTMYREMDMRFWLEQAEAGRDT